MELEMEINVSAAYTYPLLMVLSKATMMCIEINHLFAELYCNK